MSFFNVCRTYHEYACDPYFDLLTASSLCTVAPLIKGTVQQTFVALRAREGMAPFLESILKSNNFDKLIADEVDTFVQTRHFEFYNSAFHKVLGINDLASTMKIIFENDNVLRYMIGNVNFGMPMLLDVSEVMF